jgi:hypothetical protein
VNVADTLRERAARERATAAELTRRINRVSFARLAAAAGFLVAGAEALTHARYATVLGLLTAAIVVLFVLLVRASQRLAKSRHAALGRAGVNEQGAYRAERDWPNIRPQPWSWPTDESEWLRVDLDVVGRASLAQLLPAISAGIGAPRLREWLSTIASVNEIRERQAAVRELADAVELRETFELHARDVHLSEARVRDFVEWGRAEGRSEPAWLAVASRVLPTVIVACIVASAIWSTLAPVTAPLAVFFVVVTATFAGFARSRTSDAVRAAEVGARMAEAYAELATLILRARFEAPRLRAIQAALGTESGDAADRALRRLQRLSRWAEVRSSPMLHAALQALFAWDCHISRAVERWHATHGRVLDAWFSAFADMECLAALAWLAATNPSWAFPELTVESSFRVRAKELAHPLLPAETRIANDVEIGPPGTLLLISGSNMSGKSTLLRAIGLNLLLARTGGPVCAAAMSCRPVRLMTSLRVQDSLADGMSYFMAEALRLRDIIFAAETEGDTMPPVVYLVDEILRGTNSEERAVATRFIVARLLRTPAIGIITTHDLGIFDAAEVAGHVRHAHFAEKFTQHQEGERLVFDYRLREGPTTSTNALRLLALVGLTPA